MQKTIQLSTLAFLLLLVSTPLFAYEKELKGILNAKELKRIASAEKLIAKGDAIIKETASLDAEIDKLKNADGRIKTRKINKLNRQLAEKKIKASLFYNDGYKKYIDVLDDRLKVLEKAGNPIAKQIRSDIKGLEKKVRKQYNKSKNMSSPENMVELIELAQENQNKAIELQSKCLLSLTEHQIQEDNLELAVQPSTEDTTQVTEAVLADLDSTALITDEVLELPEATLTSPTNAAAATGAITASTAAVVIASDQNSETDLISEPAIKEEFGPVSEVIEEPTAAAKEVNTDVFLTVQFMADKKKATEAQIANVYKGNAEVIEMNINGWYKYSVGKHESLEQAKSMMKTENIKGFIVAYNKKQRISVKEAVSLLNGE